MLDAKIIPEDLLALGRLSLQPHQVLPELLAWAEAEVREVPAKIPSRHGDCTEAARYLVRVCRLVLRLQQEVSPDCVRIGEDHLEDALAVSWGMAAPAMSDRAL